MVNGVAALPAQLGRGDAHVPAGAERLLAEASERALRAPRDKLVVVLHLSRLPAPGPRPHHGRVARALLHGVAQHHAGQVFHMRNQDLVLLCARAPGAEAETELGPAVLPGVLSRLFEAELPQTDRLVSLWWLDRAAAPLLAYLAARADDTLDSAMREEVQADVLSLAALQQVVGRVALGELLVQQTGMSMSSDRGQPLAARLAPSFCEIGVSLAGLQPRPLVTAATGDPFLLRHFAAGLELRVIQTLHDDIVAAGRLTRPARMASLPIHVSLGMEAILSPVFARLSRRAQAAGVRLGVAVTLMQAVADLDLMAHVRDLLSLTGCEMILDGVDPLALGLVRPGALRVDLVKLTWSPLLADSLTEAGHRPSVAIARALERLEPFRIVLQDVDSDHALAWGQARGITRFQGPFIEQVQAASRMARCHSASACTLKQCRTRAAALSLSGRAGCANPALLDAGFGVPALGAEAAGIISSRPGA